MYVNRLRIDQWQGRKNFSDEIESPTWTQIVEAVEALDGESRTKATLSCLKNEDSYLIVAGPTAADYPGSVRSFITRNLFSKGVR